MIPEAYSTEVQQLLSRNPGSSYLLTEASCSSLTARSGDGNLIYAVFFGPYPDQATACLASSRISADSYVKRLDNVTADDQTIEC